MKFHDTPTMYTAARERRLYETNKYKPEAWYKELLKDIPPNKDVNFQTLFTRGCLELTWYEERRPFYNVYPVAAKSLLSVRLDLDCSLIRLPIPALAIRFAEGHEPNLHGFRLLSMLVGSMSVRDKEWPGLQITCDMGRYEDGHKVLNLQSFELPTGKTLEQAVCDVDFFGIGDTNESNAMTEAVRIVCGLCLLADDPAVIEPEPLAADQQRYDETGDPKLIERAVRRGKRGWVVGRNLTVSPHYRRPHVALRWTGPGGKVPKIVPIKGAVVHRNRLTEVPMGRLDGQTP